MSHPTVLFAAARLRRDGPTDLTIDGNEAAASVAYRVSEVVAIYPITPASAMGEHSDVWSSQGRTNVWGTVPQVCEMQSEGGAAGAVHGGLQAGALTTTFTASQGLLLMIPNLFKIAGELTPFVLHVTARTIATHALSIFGDHSDVMACRTTGLAMLASASVQEAHDFACVAHAATLRSRIPFMHFFDGFRTSHEVQKISRIGDDVLLRMMAPELIEQHRKRALTPEHPVIRGTAQNPDTFFQAREACSPYYAACAAHVQAEFDRFAELTGRRYRLFDYHGHPEAEHVVVVMGSGGETLHDVVDHLLANGRRVGVLKVRLFRPFSAEALDRALPSTVRRIAVLDRTKEPGSLGEPLYLDVLAALAESRRESLPTIVGGRYGLASKEFTPAMAKRVFDELERPDPKRRFTVGIVDDVSQSSLKVSEELDVLAPDVFQAVFWGLGSDGTVSANHNSIKIIGEETDQRVQAYFVHDSKKAGTVTVSHLRIGNSELRAPYLVRRADFVACHQFEFLRRFDVLESAREGATVLLNSPYPAETLWEHLPYEAQQAIVQKKLRLHLIDADQLARSLGLGGRINTVMQVCFFALSGVLPKDLAVAKIKEAIRKSYEKKGAELVERNAAAVDAALANLQAFSSRDLRPQSPPRAPLVPAQAPDFVQRVTAVMAAGHGDLLPVSAFPVDGTWPVGTTRWEKRNLGHEIPVWDTELCIQCNKCVLVCPHAAIRAKVYDPALLADAPEGFKATDWKSGELKGRKYSLQVAPEDCTGCASCVEVCPAKDRSHTGHKAIDMQPQQPLREAERQNYSFFLSLPEVDRRRVKLDVKDSQLLQPLFEYSGACAGCGETPYIKLLTQLFGDRALIANATGCSSIYGGNLPTTPYTTNREGRGPAWCNSLFEDNAEFGFGMRLGVDVLRDRAATLLRGLASELGERLVSELLEADQSSEAGLAAQRERIAELRAKLGACRQATAHELDTLADYLVRRSVWLVGGDGWAYDIDFGGLDHVFASDRDVNILVLDTEVYSNTGGQQSKATPFGAVAKFAAAGKNSPKKDLGFMAMSYGSVYVARVAVGAKDAQTVRAFVEADSYPGPSLIIAYSHCIAHGYDLRHGASQQKLAVDSGLWPLYRFDPRRIAKNEPALTLDSGPAKVSPLEYMRNEARFQQAEKLDPERLQAIARRAESEAAHRLALYQGLAQVPTSR